MNTDEIKDKICDIRCQIEIAKYETSFVKDVIDIAIRSFVMLVVIVAFVWAAVGVIALVHGLIVVLR